MMLLVAMFVDHAYACMQNYIILMHDVNLSIMHVLCVE